MILISELEYETVTRGRLYNFAVLNSPVTGHLGKRIINTNWKQILMKPMVLDQGHARLPHCEISNTED